MDIKTKFELDNAVYVLDNKKIIKAEIYHIDISISRSLVEITYDLEYWDDNSQYFKYIKQHPENECFDTKEKLMEWMSV